MDANGDTQGNYTLIGRQPYEITNHEDGLYPVGVFQIPRNHSTIPVSPFIAKWGKGKKFGQRDDHDAKVFFFIIIIVGSMKSRDSFRLLKRRMRLLS